MGETSKEAKARAEARLQAVAKKKAAADHRNDERLAAEQVREHKTARLKAQRLARDEGDRDAAETALKGKAEELRRKRP
jgi:hypothetical protein